MCIRSSAYNVSTTVCILLLQKYFYFRPKGAPAPLPPPPLPLDLSLMVVEVNALDKVAMILWLCVRLVRCAQKAIKSLSRTERVDHDRAKVKLVEQLEPTSNYALYEAEFQAQRKQPGEHWALLGKGI